MENYFKVNLPVVEENRIINNFTVQGKWSRFFGQRHMTVEYSVPLSGDIPASVAVIPLISVVLPLVWLCDATLETDELDEDFYNCLADVRDGYRSMYPSMHFGGKIQSKKLIKNRSEQDRTKTALFFSGGVDAYSSLVSHIDENPALITVWGADVALDDTQGWTNVCSANEKAAQIFSLDFITIRSDFRKVIRENAAERYVKRSGDGWWHGFQHSVGLFGHAAVLAYKLGIQNIYIASSYTADDIGRYTCASDPTIDNYVQFSGAHIVHDGYEYSRQDKVGRICHYSKEDRRPIELHVCWKSRGGKNCGHCEKCYRTALEIVAEGFDPQDFGFTWGTEEIQKCKRAMRRRIKISEAIITSKYYPIVDKMRQAPENFVEYQWLMDMDWSIFNRGLSKWWFHSIFYWILMEIHNKLFG